MSNNLSTNSRGRSGRHGEVRGANFNRRSSQFEGRFGRMFRTLPPADFDEDILTDLATAMTATPDEPPTPETVADDEENSGIAAGYTYLGQFVDHDLTFDPASSLQRQNDPDALVDFRTPRFDLDNIYGRGPDDQPYLYRADGLHMLLGRKLTGNDNDPAARDVPRNQPEPNTTEDFRALIGDPRDDENVIVSQLQSAMLRFHNRMVDRLGSPTFEQTQRMVRWHYQWVLLNDFLPTIIGDETLNKILPHRAKGTNPLVDPPKLEFYKPKVSAYIPIEFSAAAYRFGHSMVRPIYRMNAKMTNDTRIRIFSTTHESLLGFRAYPPDLGIDWSLFFSMGPAPPLGPLRVQPAYKIDTSLVNPLGTLPPAVAQNPASLALRNLLRGWRMGLPSGQAVARFMGIEPVPAATLKVGKAIKSDIGTNKLLTDISPRFADNAPLWYYILAEPAEHFVDDATPVRLGQVGGRIVGEVFVGLMLADSHSYLHQNPLFKPFQDFMTNGEFKMADLLRQSMQA